MQTGSLQAPFLSTVYSFCLGMQIGRLQASFLSTVEAEPLYLRSQAEPGNERIYSGSQISEVRRGTEKPGFLKKPGFWPLL